MLKKITSYLFILAFIFTIHSSQPEADSSLAKYFIISAFAQTNQWAFEETFNVSPRNPDGTFIGTPPSQTLLPKNWDYVVTHRRDTGGQLVDDERGTFPADHRGTDCEFDDANTWQHSVSTSNDSNTLNPDDSFFICKDHMMTSMGHVSGYSVTATWPRQEFDFTNGGTLEFDTNLTANARAWWEVLISPRAQMKMGAAEDWLPIDETYPKERIVFTYTDRAARHIKVGTGKVAPDGWIADAGDWREFGGWIPDSDPAKNNRKIRRKHRITFSNNKIVWGIQLADGSFEEFDLDVPAGLPFKRGIVMFKTHAYTPEKDGNMDHYTTHWDNVRFTGPKIAPYEAFETTQFVTLQANGSVPIGSTQTVTIDLPKVGPNPVLFGHIEGVQVGQGLLSINGGPNISIVPHDVTCVGGGWGTFYYPLNGSQLKVGTNTFKWTVGPRNPCVDSWTWDGFGVKALEVQFDTDPNATPVPTWTPTPTLTPTLTPTPPPPGTTLNAGVTTVGSQTDTGDANFLSIIQITTGPVGGTLTSASAHVASGGQFEMGLYTNNNNTPGTLLARSDRGNLTANIWNTVAFTGANRITLTPNTKYWLVYNTDSANLHFTSGATPLNGWSTNGVTFGIWPANFGAFTSSNLVYSMYATITTASTVSATPAPKKLGDVDGNGIVDIYDFNELVAHFGETGANIDADLDKSGEVGIEDFNEVVANFSP